MNPNRFVALVTEYRKAVGALFGTAIGTAILALADGVITPAEWGAIALAVLGVPSLVAALPSNGKHAAGADQ